VNAAAPALALRLEAVEAGYDRQPVLRGVTADLAAGKAVALLGSNGSGKSTLVKVVLGLLRPWSGRIEVFGRPPDRFDHRKSQVGYLPQLREADRSFPVTVSDLAMMGRVGRLGLFRRPGRRDRELVRDALADVRLTNLADRLFGTLSGGQQQRAFLARALVQEPDLLVLDEPMAGVDAESREQIGEILERLRERGTPLLVVTHDLNELEPFVFDQQWTLVNGQLRVGGPSEARLDHPPDRHETIPDVPAARRGPGLFGLRPGATGWG
jgi:ABC-type Mn2+/Zn2+ transport system ATPase subunit